MDNVKQLDDLHEALASTESELRDAREALARMEAERHRLGNEVIQLSKRLCICHECGGRGEVHTGEYTNEGQWQPPEPVMVECGECAGDGQIGQVTDLDAAMAQRDTAQAQLAEVVGLLRAIDRDIWPEWESRFGKSAALINVQAFLADYTHAEQQEAQGPQAGDERATFESHAAFVGMDFSRAEGHAEYYESPFANGAWEGWKARAALATQPAAGATSDKYRAELYDEVWQKARDMGYVNVTMALVALEHLEAAPPAAAHGDEAVRKDDRVPGLEWAINKCTAMQEHGFDRVRLDLFKRDLQGALAAMRAQAGEGGE